MVKAFINSDSIQFAIQLFGIIVATFTAILSVGYWFKPKFQICIMKTESHVIARVTNRNFFKNKIKDINCEITLSKNKEFDETVRTMELIKPWIVCLKKPDSFYLFKAKIDPAKLSNNIKGMKFVRVRLLAPNFLGIKKVKEEIQRL